MAINLTPGPLEGATFNDWFAAADNSKLEKLIVAIDEQASVLGGIVLSQISLDPEQERWQRFKDGESIHPNSDQDVE